MSAMIKISGDDIELYERILTHKISEAELRKMFPLLSDEHFKVFRLASYASTRALVRRGLL